MFFPPAFRSAATAGSRAAALALPILFLMIASGFSQTAATAAAATAAAAPSAANAKTILFLGDSISAGYGLDNAAATSFPALIQQKIKEQGLPYMVVNAGVSGDTSAGGLRRIDWLLRRPPEVLVLELGGNDGLRGIPPNETQKNLQAIIDKVKVKNPQAHVIVAGMRMPPNFGADYVTRFAEIFPALAKANDATLIPFVLEGVGGHPELNQRDQIHPTAEGHRIIAATIWPYLAPFMLKG